MRSYSLRFESRTVPTLQTPSSEYKKYLKDKATAEKQKASDNDLLKHWDKQILQRYAWDEFATCTFKSPQHDQYRAIAMFKAWLHGRYFQHAVSVGEATRTQMTKCVNGEPLRRLSREWNPLTGMYEPIRKMVVHTKYKGKMPNAWKRNDKKRPVWVVGVEKHKNGSNHIHALIHHRMYADAMRRDAGWRSWHDERGYGRMRLEKPESDSAVRKYLSKYVIKDGDIELSRTFTRKSVTG